jgi:hypothetical protein
VSECACVSVCKASQNKFFDTYGIWCDRLAMKESRERISWMRGRTMSYPIVPLKET